MKTNTAIKVGAAIAIIGFVGYSIYDLPTTPQAQAREVKPAPVRSKPPARRASTQAPTPKSTREEMSTVVPHWVFSEHLDTFDGKTTKGAYVNSVNMTDLGDLYGRQFATLIIGSDSDSRFAGFTVGKGHIIGDYIEAKGDDGIIERFAIVDTDIGTLNTVIIKDFSRFYALVTRSTVVTVRATFYRVGARDFSFDVTE